MEHFYRHLTGFFPALFCGLAAAAMDWGGVAGGTSWCLGAAELVCGVIAGWGFAVLWMRPHLRKREKAAQMVLLLLHIAFWWLWIPFGLALFCRGMEKSSSESVWIQRCFFVLIASACFAGGALAVYCGFFSANPDLSPWWSAAGAAAALLGPWAAAKMFLPYSGRDCRRLVCRTGFFGGILLLVLLWKHTGIWRVNGGYFAAVLILSACCGVALLFSGGLKENFCREWRYFLLSGILICGLLGVVQYRLLRNLVPEAELRSFQLRRQDSAEPAVAAYRKYVAEYGRTPENPEILQSSIVRPEMKVYGLDTDENGTFRIFFHDGTKLPAFCWTRSPDGREYWELVVFSHPLLKPGDRRWRHAFPY